MIYFLETYQKILSSVPELNTGELMSEEDRLKASRYIREEDRDRFIAARILFYTYLKSKIPSLESLKTLKYNSYGKPVMDIGNLSFNWSHSGDFIALMVGERECGIDVELHSGKPLFDYKSICTEREWTWIQAGDRTERFYQIWTAKESVLKATGFGLSINPVDIEIVYQKGREYIANVMNWKKYFGCSYRLKENEDDYSWSWCTNIKTDVNQYNLESVMKYLSDN